MGNYRVYNRATNTAHTARRRTPVFVHRVRRERRQDFFNAYLLTSFSFFPLFASVFVSSIPVCIKKKNARGIYKCRK